MNLREYEIDWIRRIKESRKQRILAVGPTGCGKTVVAAHLTNEAIQRWGRVLFIAHRRELVQQAANRLIEVGIRKADIGIIQAGCNENREAPVQVASIQTLTRRVLPPADLMFIDEAHHAAARSYRRALDSYGDAIVIGLTATPYRLDGKPLGDLFEDIIESKKPSKLIEQGWLNRPRVWTVPEEDRPNLSGVAIKAGDFDVKQLEGATKSKKLVGSIVEHWKRLAEGRPTVCYAVSVAHGKRILAAFRASGISAELVTGETNLKARRAILDRLASGSLSVVVNCMVLTEGWDCPAARCAIVARPTRSQSLWFQMCGRIMRPGEREPIVLDHAGNALWHPLPGTDIEFSLTEEQKKPRKPGQTKEKTCGDCGCSMPIVCRVCPNCGHEFWTGDPPEEVQGELRERQHPICEKCSGPLGVNASRNGAKICRNCFVRKPILCSRCGKKLSDITASRVRKGDGTGMCAGCAGYTKHARESCVTCGSELAIKRNDRVSTGYCRDCWPKFAPKKPQIICLDCGSPLRSAGARSSGYKRCKPCAMKLAWKARKNRLQVNSSPAA